jgi:hypothetical protein
MSPLVAVIAPEGGGRDGSVLRHGYDAIETGCAKEADQSGAAARHRHLPSELPHVADPAYESAQAGGVDERHAGQIDDQTPRRYHSGQRLTELADGKRLQLPYRPTDGITLCCDLLVNLEHARTMPRGSKDALGSR